VRAIGKRGVRQLAITGDAAQRCAIAPDLERECGRDRPRMLRRGTACDPNQDPEPASRR